MANVRRPKAPNLPIPTLVIVRLTLNHLVMHFGYILIL
jgi:hypothetical protein